MRSHCNNNHEFTPENTIVFERGIHAGERRCRICLEANRMRQKARNEKKQEEKIKKKKDSWYF